jgi:hypothetical protein
VPRSTVLRRISVDRNGTFMAGSDPGPALINPACLWHQLGAGSPLNKAETSMAPPPGQSNVRSPAHQTGRCRVVGGAAPSSDKGAQRLR